MKHISIFMMSLLAFMLLSTSCNDEWSQEQYLQYVGFKAPLNDNGVTAVYVPYSRHNDDGSLQFNEAGLSDYSLPVVISGSTHNAKEITIHVGHDADTLNTLNYARYQNRRDLYYVDMKDYATYPETLPLKSGEDVGLLNIRFNFKNIDMVNKWVLPIQILDDSSYGSLQQLLGRLLCYDVNLGQFG